MAAKTSANLWAIALWAFVLIMALSGAIIGGIFLTQDEEYVLGALAIMTGLGLSGFSLKKIIEHDRAWKVNVKDEIITETASILAAWTYPMPLWESFVEKDLVYKRNETLKIASITLVMVIVGLGIGAWNAADDLETFLFIAVPIILGFILLIGLISFFSTKHFRDVYLKLSEGQRKPGVIISLKGIVINDALLTAFKFFGGKLSGVKMVDKFDHTCIEFSIYTSNGKNSTTKHYYIPLINQQKEEAKGIIEQLKSHYQL